MSDIKQLFNSDEKKVIEVESMEDLQRVLAEHPWMVPTGGGIAIVDQDDNVISDVEMPFDELVFNMHVQEVINQMRFTPLTKVDYDPEKQAWVVEIVGWPSVDIENPKPVDFLGATARMVTWPTSGEMTDVAIAIAIRDAIVNAYTHEVDEYVAFQGRRLRNPHPNSDTYAPNTWEGGE